MSDDNQPGRQVIVVGAGAAGLMAAIAARGAVLPDGTLGEASLEAPDVLLVDGQEQPGRKILIAGGGRCNVTNAIVAADDFTTGQPRLVRNALRSFGTTQAQTFFESLGVPLKTEPLGKIFPVSNKARDILDALLAACERVGVETSFGDPVRSIIPVDDGWSVDGRHADRVVLSTGGRSVPATGSTGFGLDLATSLGHQVVGDVPALAPLLGEADEAMAGLTVPAIARVCDPDGTVRARAAGSVLFTHKGITGPAAFDISGEVELAASAGTSVQVLLDLWSLADPAGPFGPHLTEPKLPGCCLAELPAARTVHDVDKELAALFQASPASPVWTILAKRLPKRLSIIAAGPLGEEPGGQVRREDRRALAERLVNWTVPVDTTGGWPKAEVTLGGVPLDELQRATLESRLAPGLHLCGEVCDVTGRLGGFNFQWAWTSGYLAGCAAGSAVPAP